MLECREMTCYEYFRQPQSERLEEHGVECVTIKYAAGPERPGVTKLSPKHAQNGQKPSKSTKLKSTLSCSWRRDLVEFSVR
jgi:hypothetical protein